jgi:hypothetical protein
MGERLELPSFHSSPHVAPDGSHTPPPEADQTSGNADRRREPEFISIPEWARRIGLSSESGYKAARLGQIPGCFNIGRLYRVNWPVFVEAPSWMRSGPGEAA